MQIINCIAATDGRDRDTHKYILYIGQCVKRYFNPINVNMRHNNNCSISIERVILWWKMSKKSAHHYSLLFGNLDNHLANCIAWNIFPHFLFLFIATKKTDEHGTNAVCSVHIS